MTNTNTLSQPVSQIHHLTESFIKKGPVSVLSLRHTGGDASHI